MAHRIVPSFCRCLTKHSVQTINSNVAKFFSSSNRALRGDLQVSQDQILTSDGRTIVCIHPKAQKDVMDTKPLVKDDGPGRRLSVEQEKIVRQLRSEDPSLWTANRLARLFLVSPEEIGRTSPMTKERRAQLLEEKRILSGLPHHQRRKHMLEQEVVKKERLEDALKERKHLFPLYQQEQNNNERNS